VPTINLTTNILTGRHFRQWSVSSIRGVTKGVFKRTPHIIEQRKSMQTTDFPKPSSYDVQEHIAFSVLSHVSYIFKCADFYRLAKKNKNKKQLPSNCNTLRNPTKSYFFIKAAKQKPKRLINCET
jgi:hypothetical protein